MSLKPLCAAVLAVAGISSATAAPFASSSLDLTTLQFSLQDTDASDGIAAGFSSQFVSSIAYACVTPSSDGSCWASTLDGSYGETSDPTGTVEATAANDTVLATATAGPLWTSALQYGEGATSANGGAAGMATYQLGFRGTGRFTAAVDYDVAADLGGTETWREVLAWAGIVIGSGQGFFQTEQLAVAPGDGSTAAHTGRLTLSFDVLDGQQYTAFLRTHTHSLSPIAAPVPEPATWALMLAGLAGVVPLARRRRG